ncbi:Putative ribonuclease H protein At1g65750 [Linum perenne]
MLEGAKSAIRNGQDTLFWTSCWIESGLRLADYADISKPDFNVDCTVAEMTMEDGGWNFELLDSLLQPEMIDLVAGMSPPQPNRGEDDWIWGREDSGNFTIKSAYDLICQTEETPTLSIWKTIWRWDGPNRIRHFLWLAARNRLLTNESRKHRGMSQEAGCEFCHVADESVCHVLRDCLFARETWRSVKSGELDKPDWQLPLVDWLESYLKSEKGLQFGVVCWYLWRARNERLFAGGRDKPKIVALKAGHWINSITEAACREAILDTGIGRKRRSPRGQAAAGGLIRDASGNCILAYTMNLGVCSITRAEICGALEGVRRAWEAGYRKLVVQLDSRAAVAILTSPLPASSHQYTLEVLEFQELLHQEWEVKVLHVYREGNQAADYLVNLGHNTIRGTHAVDISDCNLAYFVRYDCLGISEPRLIK